MGSSAMTSVCEAASLVLAFTRKTTSDRCTKASSSTPDWGVQVVGESSGDKELPKELEDALLHLDDRSPLLRDRLFNRLSQLTKLSV